MAALSSAAVRAQPPAEGKDALYLVLTSADADAGDPARWLHALEAQVDAALRSVAQPWPGPAGDEAPPDALALLEDVERALSEARELNARFRERAALRVLWGAAQALLENAWLPGAHAYLAEVYLQLGLCAAQLGERGLAETALTRAASLDPTRHVEAAEAPPSTLAWARQIEQRHAGASEGELTVQSQPRDAELWLDGQRLPSAQLRAPSGEHLLVVRAAGHAPYATLLQLQPGLRPALAVQLAPLPAEQARRALWSARSDPTRAKEAAASLARTSGLPVYLLEPAPSGERALVWRCLAGGCQLPRSLQAGALAAGPAGPGARRGGQESAALASRGERPPYWKRWPLWTGLGALVVAGVTSALLLREPPAARRERALEVRPDPLPP